MKKSPRSWNRREFNAAPAGDYFLLKPAGFFPAWRLPVGFRYRFRETENAATAAGQPAAGPEQPLETTAPTPAPEH